MERRLDVVGNDAPHAQRLREAAALVLASPAFVKAPRMRQLLMFLVDTSLAGQRDQLCEYGIGLAVFRRDPQHYDTAADPVVRVQMGRLRARLTAYYRMAQVPAALRIDIPRGSYLPQLGPASARRGVDSRLRLQLRPLRDLSLVDGSAGFVCGLDEELGARLFQIFGRAVEAPAHDAQAVGEEGYHLDGSIRVEPQRVRASLRLMRAGRIAWVAQFDALGELDMALQAALAADICSGLQRHLTPSGLRWSTAQGA